MPTALFYPNYMPDKKWVRSSLLLFDDLKTIVPKEDQENVRGRPHVRELLDKNSNIINFAAPNVEIYEKAFSDVEISIDHLIAQIEESMKENEDIEISKESNENRYSLKPGPPQGRTVLWGPRFTYGTPVAYENG